MGSKPGNKEPHRQIAHRPETKIRWGFHYRLTVICLLRLAKRVPRLRID